MITNNNKKVVTIAICAIFIFACAFKLYADLVQCFGRDLDPEDVPGTTDDYQFICTYTNGQYVLGPNSVQPDPPYVTSPNPACFKVEWEWDEGKRGQDSTLYKCDDNNPTYTGDVCMYFHTVTYTVIKYFFRGTPHCGPYGTTFCDNYEVDYCQTRGVQITQGSALPPDPPLACNYAR